MTEPTRYAALAARLLRERPAPKESRLGRDVGISVVAHAVALRRKRRSARLFKAAAGLAAAAAIVLAFGAVRRSAPSAAARCRGAGCATAGARDASRRGLDAGQSIVAPAGAPTSVVLASGTQIALDAKSVLECKDATATQRYALLRGGAHLHVAKLQKDERFLVDTPHAEVEVRGTVFDVKVEPPTDACGARTFVTVHEGRVEVRANGTGISLVAGEQWTSSCVRPEPLTADAAAKQPAPATQPHPKTHSVWPEMQAPPTPDPSSQAAADPNPNGASALSEQNDLYAAAEAARRTGRSTEALVLYARLLGAFPRGQLAESALAARARLLSHGDPASARAEAERYLAHYPTGFARAEMEALARVP
jgi:ferric-dicitrate binding protein FerR (iron transport regulator)